MEAHLPAPVSIPYHTAMPASAAWVPRRVTRGKQSSANAFELSPGGGRCRPRAEGAGGGGRHARPRVSQTPGERQPTGKERQNDVSSRDYLLRTKCFIFPDGRSATNHRTNNNARHSNAQRIKNHSGPASKTARKNGREESKRGRRGNGRRSRDGRDDDKTQKTAVSS